jgi:hypothetical protein
MSFNERINLSDFSSEDGSFIVLFIEKKFFEELFLERHRHGSILETTDRKMRLIQSRIHSSFDIKLIFLLVYHRIQVFIFVILVHYLYVHNAVRFFFDLRIY